MRVLVITNLFPSVAQPRRGLFNLRQLEALARLDELHVVCPAPTLPGTALLRRLAGHGANERASSAPNGMPADYPGYPYVPRVGQLIHHRLFEHGIRGTVGAAVIAFRPDVLYATWSYPDVVAANRLARRHRLPLVAKVHGTDVNDYFNRPRRRRLIVEALRDARASVAVSTALADRLRAAGVESARVHVIPNGVDTDCFTPRGRETARTMLSLTADASVVLFVGNLKPVKGIDVLLHATVFLSARRRGVTLVVIGDGPERRRLEAMAHGLGIGPAVRFLGERDPADVARWMRAADVLCLPSRSEGMPNVLLEAGACGLPVVASRVGGIPEVVREGQSGLLVSPGDTAALARALQEALARRWDPREVAAAARPHSWSENAAHLHRVMQQAAGGDRPDS